MKITVLWLIRFQKHFSFFMESLTEKYPITNGNNGCMVFSHSANASRVSFIVYAENVVNKMNKKLILTKKGFL